MKLAGTRLRLVLIAVPVLALVAGGIAYAVKYAERIPTACTLIGGSNTLSLTFPPSLRVGVATVSIELSQGDRSRRIDFVPELRDYAGEEIPDNVEPSVGGRFHFGLGDDGLPGSGLAAHWDGDRTAKVVVVGYDKARQALFRHRESFRFGHFYPNGKACDGDGYLTHDVKVSSGDFAADLD